MFHFIHKGIWADESDNDADDKPSFKNKKVPKNYTAPIGFVAGGVQQANKNNNTKKNNEQKIEECVSDEEKPSTSFKIKNSSSDSEGESVSKSGIWC